MRPTPDGDRGSQHADAAQDLLAEAARLPEQLMLGFVMRAAAHAALAVYYELRAHR